MRSCHLTLVYINVLFSGQQNMWKICARIVKTEKTAQGRGQWELAGGYKGKFHLSATVELRGVGVAWAPFRDVLPSSSLREDLHSTGTNSIRWSCEISCCLFNTVAAPCRRLSNQKLQHFSNLIHCLIETVLFFGDRSFKRKNKQ